MSKTLSLAAIYHYIRLSIEPSISEPLALRKLLELAMSQSFGVSRSATYMDILWLSNDGTEAVIRVGISDAEAVLAAVVVLDNPVRLRVMKDSTFLPAILADADGWSRSQFPST